jgi:hypothetical protein
MKFLRQRDYTAIDKGIELVRTLNKSIIFESLLEGCSIDANGKIIRNKAFTGTGPAQPYLDIALLGLIRSAHSLSKLDESLILSNIKINEFQKSNFDMLKMKLETMLKHSIPIKEIDKIKLIIEDSWGGHLSGHDGIEECLKGVGYTILDSPFYGPGYAIAFGNDFLLFDNSSNVGNTPYGVEGSFEFKNSPMGGNMCVYIKKIITEDDVREYLLSLGFNN